MKNFLYLLPAVMFAALIAPLSAQEKPARIPAGYTAEKIETPQGVSLGVGGMEFAPDGSLMLCTRVARLMDRSKDERNLRHPAR